MAASDLTKSGTPSLKADLDEIDLNILAVLQDDCKTSLARIGEAVGLSAPSVVERIRKMEEAGVITGYHAVLDGRRIGLDVTAFIGVSINYPQRIEQFESDVLPLAPVMEIHHVTGTHSLLLKVRTWNTRTLEALISRLREVDGVQRTDTMVVLSTRAERVAIPLGLPGEEPAATLAPIEVTRAAARRTTPARKRPARRRGS